MDIDAITSYTCNLNCDHCSISKFLDNRKVNYDNIILPYSTECFRIGGGEPLLNNLDGLKRFICKYPKVEFRITTNLIYPLTEQRLYILRKIQHPMTSFDIGGIRFKNVKDISLWYHNAKRLIREKPHSAGVFVCIHKKFDENKTERLVKLFAKMGFADCVFIPVINYGNAAKNDLAPNKEKVIKVLDILLSIKDKYKINHETFMLLKYKSYSGCYYDPVKPLSLMRRIVCLAADKKGRFNIKRCLFENNNVCTRFGCALECATCENYMDCGGRCLYSKCYYNKDIMERIKKL